MTQYRVQTVWQKHGYQVQDRTRANPEAHGAGQFVVFKAYDRPIPANLFVGMAPSRDEAIRLAKSDLKAHRRKVASRGH